MRLHTWSDVEHMQADHVFRTPPWGMLLLPLVLLAICAAVGWGLLAGYLPCFFWASVALIAPFVPLSFSTNFLPALRQTNWVLKVRGDRLYLMLRNFRERHFADDGPTVVSLEAGEIASVGKLAQRLSAPTSRGSDMTWTQHQLEIRLRKVAPEAFVQALEAERRRKPPAKGFIQRTSYYPPPVTMPDARTIRILWRGRYDVVKPPVERAVQILKRQVAEHRETHLDRSNPEELSEREFDDLILDLCDSGAHMAAVKLLKKHRGLSLSDARQFVDELRSH